MSLPRFFSTAGFLLALQFLTLTFSAAQKSSVLGIIDSLPSDSADLILNCKSDVLTVLQKLLKNGQDLLFFARVDKVFNCEARWGKATASWSVFKPDIDVNQDYVYWKVKEDGFYHGWDLRNWSKLVEWKP